MYRRREREGKVGPCLEPPGAGQSGAIKTLPHQGGEKRGGFEEGWGEEERRREVLIKISWKGPRESALRWGDGYTGGLGLGTLARGRGRRLRRNGTSFRLSKKKGGRR